MSNDNSNSSDLDVEQSIRGGNWVLAGKYCRLARCNKIWPDYRSSYCGFRLVLREIGRVRDNGEKKDCE